MTTKTSPPTTNPTGGVKIKKEIHNDEIKDFAETAMNELLGWYGYDGVDRIDLSSKASRLMSNTSSNPSDSQHNRSEANESKCSQRRDSTTSDHDSRSSREDSKSPCSGKAVSEKQDAICGWCRRAMPENAPEFLTTNDGPRYCSESCFAQSRRASFKKAKTCDWCKHVRHAVSYVDFQDGASQLQFCSDKCLNQYKMQIFCKETQAHLDMNPHLKDKGLETTSGAGLITPELWLKNCRSRSASPASTISVSPTPTAMSSAQINTLRQAASLQITTPQTHKPIISVAPVAKLMSKSPGILNSRQSPKHSRKKRPCRSVTAVNNALNNSTNVNNLIGGGHHYSHNGGNCQSNNNNQNYNHNHTYNNNKLKQMPNNIHNTSPAHAKQCTSYSNNAQDLRLNMSPLSTMEGPPQPPPTTLSQSSQHQVPRQPSSMPPHPYFNHGPNNFPVRNPFFTSAHHPRLMSGLPPPQIPPPDLNGMASLFGPAPPVTVMVPYPVIIPFPIPIPVPLPLIDFYNAATKCSQQNSTKLIPTPPEKPIPGSADKNADNMESCSSQIGTQPALISESEQPLDFTKAKTDKVDVLSNLEETPSPVTFQQHMEISSSHVHHSPSATAQRDPCDANYQHLNHNKSDNKINDDDDIVDDVHQKLPKFKITRLQTKRLITKESECSRPLRKRKRIIDCDYLRIVKDDHSDNDNNTNSNCSNNKFKK